MVGFLFLGQSILKLFGLDVASFAVAGAIVIFIVAMEMLLGITLIKDDPDSFLACGVHGSQYPDWHSLKPDFCLPRASVFLVAGTETWKICVCCTTKGIRCDSARHCCENL